MKKKSRNSDNPPPPTVEINLAFETKSDVDYYSLTIRFRTNLFVPTIPASFPLPARRLSGGVSRGFRWLADKPFIFIPKESGDWQTADWDKWLFVPRGSNWFVVFSKPYTPNGTPKGHYLELATRSFGKSTKPDEADYTIIPLDPDTSLRKLRTLKIIKPGLVKEIRELLEGIFTSYAVKATIIISE